MGFIIDDVVQAYLNFSTYKKKKGLFKPLMWIYVVDFNLKFVVLGLGIIEGFA